MGILKEFYFMNKKRILLVGIFLVVTLVALYIVRYSSNEIVYEAASEGLELVEENIVVQTKEVTELEKQVYVDIKGMVNNPGVYQIGTDKRVNDVILLAGGLSDGAVTKYINLSKKVTDEMVIIIYSQKELDEISNQDKYLEVKKEEVLNYLKDNYDKLVKESLQSVVNQEISLANIDEKKEVTEKSGELLESKVYNLNTVTVEELLEVPGIGLTKAEAIIQYKEDNNGYKSIEELLNIKGIGQATYEKIASYFTI